MGKITTLLGYKAYVYTNGMCASGYPANNCQLNAGNAIRPNTLVRIYDVTIQQYPIRAVVENLRNPRPGYTGYSHYKFLNALNQEIEFIVASSAGYYINHLRIESVNCSADSCRVDCATSADGFCCIDHSATNRLLQVLTA